MVKIRALIAVAGLAGASVHAATFTVTNTNDSGPGSLRDTVAAAIAAGAANAVTFDPAVTGTIVLTTGEIAITGPVAIAGPGSDVLTIDANANSRVFSIYENVADACATPGADFSVSVSGLTLTNAISLSGGGAIYTEKSLALDSIVITKSRAGDGGGVQMQMLYAGQSLSIVNSQFVGNVATDRPPFNGSATGGGLSVDIRCYDPSPIVSPVSISIASSLFSGNHATQCDVLCGHSDGAGIHVGYASDVTITNSRIVGNILDLPADSAAFIQGGGVSVSEFQTLRLEGSEVSGNTGAYQGGGVYIESSSALTTTATFVNSTISGNTVSILGGWGGGIYAEGAIFVLLENSTITDNLSGFDSGGGIWLEIDYYVTMLAPSLALVSTIVAKSRNDVPEIGFCCDVPFVVSASQSLVGPVGSGVTVTGSGNLLGVDPRLGPLTFNGGPMRTHALLAGSPAIDAGSNPLGLTTDQRGTGFDRVVGAAADMGAYEAGSGAAPVLLSAASRRKHGTVAFFDLPLSMTSVNPTTEPRQGPAQNIVFTFDRAVDGATVAITEGTATAGAPSFSGNDVVVPLTGVTNQQYVTIAVQDVAASAGGTTGTGSVRVGFLAGDVDQNRVVTLSDLGLVNRGLTQSVTAATFLMDVNASGALTFADKGIVNANLTRSLPAP
jgi:hypothetical protein